MTISKEEKFKELDAIFADKKTLAAYEEVNDIRRDRVAAFEYALKEKFGESILLDREKVEFYKNRFREVSSFEPDVDPELQEKFDRITAAFSDKATLAMYEAELKTKRDWDATLQYAIKERVEAELKKLGIKK
ncbi:hypothetical protein P4679_25115 [Priestia megaterium]|uniref:hypothetical protein n=1 Tax=Priestia megaterium TaxID=1404 RepID=UPI002E1C0D41|nr:hypothetical protein [Priestia megaterium]